MASRNENGGSRGGSQGGPGARGGSNHGGLGRGRGADGRRGRGTGTRGNGGGRGHRGGVNTHGGLGSDRADGEGPRDGQGAVSALGLSGATSEQRQSVQNVPPLPPRASIMPENNEQQLPTCNDPSRILLQMRLTEELVDSDEVLPSRAILASTSHAGGSSERQSSKQVMWLLPDHNLSAHETDALVTAAKYLKNEGFTVTTIGKNADVRRTFEDVCGSGTAFAIRHWSNFRACLPSPQNSARSTIHESLLEIEFSTVSGEIRLLADPLPVSITIRNIGAVAVAPDSIIRIDGGSFYHEKVCNIGRAIPKFCGVYNVQTTLVPRPGVDATLLPDTVIVSVTNTLWKKPYFSKYCGFVIPSRILAGDVLKWDPKHPKVANSGNVIVLGLRGAGKSTLINQLLSVFDDDYVSAAPAFTADVPVTTESAVYQPSGVPNLLLVDTVAVSSVRLDNYSIPLVTAMVRGLVPVTVNVLPQRPFSENELLSMVHTCPTEPTLPRGLHAAIFVVQSSVMKNVPEILARLRQYHSLLTELGVPPTFVITFADAVPAVQRTVLKRDVSNCIGVPSNRIFLLDNQPLIPNDPGFTNQRKNVLAIFHQVLQTIDQSHARLAKSRPSRSNVIKSVDNGEVLGELLGVLFDPTTNLATVRQQITQEALPLGQTSYVFVKPDNNQVIAVSSEESTPCSVAYCSDDDHGMDIVFVKLRDN